MSAYEHFADSVRYFAARDLDAALASARRACQSDPDEVLYTDAARYLEKMKERGGQSIYSEGDAFTAFISGGGNLPLYDNARAMLAERLQEVRPGSLLDIGTGEGTLIVPVAASLEREMVLTFCEPAVALLDRALDFAWDCGLRPDAFPYPIQELLKYVDSTWEVAVATWSLQNVPPRERVEVFRKLSRRVTRLYIAEFDDSSGSYDDPLDPGRIRAIHDRYIEGLQEYPGQEGRRVRLGFMLPVLYGYFGREGQRSTYEQPIEYWERELRVGGFEVVERTLIYPYWWANAYLLVAESTDDNEGEV
jgi:ubiquinone/menaquinone biosynthesis C-methylase UbiE